MSRVSNGEDKSKVKGVAMSHNLIGWKSKFLDKWIRGNPKRTNGEVTCGKMRPPT